MRSRAGTAGMAVVALVGGGALVAACGGPAAAFHPAGALPAASASGPASLSPETAGAGIVFETPLPTAATQRAIVIGYQNYARSRWAGRTVSGPIRYFDIAVTGVYFANGAAVSSCVDAAGRRYLEQVAEGRRPDGTWFVTHADTYPITSSQGASCQ